MHLHKFLVALPGLSPIRRGLKLDYNDTTKDHTISPHKCRDALRDINSMHPIQLFFI
jgi:hypothetical protein